MESLTILIPRVSFAYLAVKFCIYSLIVFCIISSSHPQLHSELFSTSDSAEFLSLNSPQYCLVQSSSILTSTLPGPHPMFSKSWVDFINEKREVVRINTFYILEKCNTTMYIFPLENLVLFQSCFPTQHSFSYTSFNSHSH